MRNQYRELGLGLFLAGIGLIPTAYLLLHSIPLIALGISLVILGAVCLALGRSRPTISPEVSSLLMETGKEGQHRADSFIELKILRREAFGEQSPIIAKEVARA